MKSKAKRNNNRPASFREKCRNAFAGAIKGLANINAAEKENVAASFDLDKRSVERRIDAMEKNRAVAKRIAEGCIKGDPSFNFDDEWIAINILMDPPYNVGEEMFCYRDGRILRLAIIERGQDVVGGINVLNGKKRVFLLKFPGSHADGVALLLEFGEILFGLYFR